MTTPTIPVTKPEDSDIIGEGAEAIRETRQAIYDVFPIGPSDLDYADTSGYWPAGSLTGGQEPGLDSENPPTTDEFQDRAFLIGDQMLRWDYTIPAGKNAISPGPLDLGGVTVTVPDGATWTIVGTEDLDVRYLRDLADVEAGSIVTDLDALLWHEGEQLWRPGPAPEGPPGPPGPGFDFKGEISTSTALPGWPDSYTGDDGDTYVTQDLFHIWSWDGNEWVDSGPMGIKGDKGDKGDPGTSPDMSEYPKKASTESITGAWSMTNPTNVFYGDGSNLTNIPEPDLGLYATKVYSNDGDSSTLTSAKDYTDAKIANIPAPPAGLQLDNTAAWTHGQYNAMFSPTISGSGLSSRFTWDGELQPVVRLSDSTVATFVAVPSNPTVDGMFIAIQWVSHGNSQDWSLDTGGFGPDTIVPVDDGKNVTKVFCSNGGLWYEVG
ncbi:MAG: hypothetical protein HOG25_09780 [Gammaproteobacteria bacterium]|jgi:hypothetical protein|nr:hypothetical protein [Gammaproteobacteria bacterium]